MSTLERESPTAAAVTPARAEVVNPLSPGDRVLVVGAHPDDETIGAGRLLAQHPGDVRAVTLTGGEACVVSDRLDPQEVRERRLAEWRAAVRALGAETVETPLLPDGGLEQHEPAVAATVLEAMAAADVLVTTWRHDPHPDHRAVGRACAEVARATGARLVEYPVWAPSWMTEPEIAQTGCRLCVVPTGPAADAARSSALRCYASQTGPLLPGLAPVVPVDLLARHDRQLLVCPSLA